MTEKVKESVFNVLNKIDAANKVKTKGKLSYVSWASAWAEIKKIYPDAQYRVYPQIMDEYGNTRFWHDDGKTGWVEVGVTIEDNEIIETLAIMDFKNASIPVENITSADANKAMKRCLTKALALHGLFLYIYEGEDLPEDDRKLLELKEKIKNLVVKKCNLSEGAKEKVGKLCKEAERKAHPEVEDDAITGNYNTIDDIEILTDLEKRLMAVRK